MKSWHLFLLAAGATMAAKVFKSVAKKAGISL